MTKPLRMLIVEDSESDAKLLQLAVNRGGYEVAATVVETAAAMRAALERQDWDVVTSDHAMPQFSAPAALALARELRPHLPFIIVSGEIDINLAVSLMKEGADDYIQKRELPRIILAIERALHAAEARREGDEIKHALQISETRYRRLFETAQDGILILDADTGKITDVNPFLLSMLNYAKEDFLGKQLWEIGAFKDAKASKEAFKELQAKGYVRYEDLPLETKDKKLVSVEFVSNVYLVDHTKTAQCNIRDITARKQAESEICKLNADLEQRVQERTGELESLNLELEAFNYSVSHDLRAPTRRILGFTDALRYDYANNQSEETLKVIQSIRGSAEHMNALITALLKLARLSRGDLKRHPVDVSALVGRIAAGLQQSDPARKVEFTIAPDITGNADEPLLVIVMENLLANAWKFVGGRESARIEFGAALQSDGKLAYFVRDNGAGFDMAYAGKLFGTFQRLHGEKEFPGIGIGLATVQRIIHRHGGKVWAEAAVDKGATFFFTLGGLTMDVLDPTALS